MGKIIPAPVNYFLDQWLQRAMVWSGVLRPTKNMDLEKISLRTTVFLKEAEKAGIECENLLARSAPTNYFRLKSHRTHLENTLGRDTGKSSRGARSEGEDVSQDTSSPKRHRDRARFAVSQWVADIFSFRGVAPPQCGEATLSSSRLANTRKSSATRPESIFKMGSDRFHYFEGLPRAEQRETRVSKIIDDKSKVKDILLADGLPAVNGRAFSWRQKNQAIRWSSANLNFPLVVKPRFGSMSQHITMNIQDAQSLKSAIDTAVRYSPFFIVENFLAGAQTYRATVIDFNLAGCVKRLPAHVVGDGRRTVKELVEIKNQDLRRGNPKAKDTTLYKLVMNETAEQLLQSQNLSWRAILPKEKTAFLQEKVILDLGGDLHEESARAHPDNRELFIWVARLFNTRLVGVDFLARDISISWKEQPCAIMELNSLPYIDMHHFPAVGEPANPAAAICRMVKKYY